VWCFWGFNPRPHAGGDCPRGAARRSSSRFNPRPHAGGDFRRPPLRFVNINVSIHAPTRGATTMIRCNWQLAPFQSTPPRGGRPMDNIAITTTAEFQSTPPRGGRPFKFCYLCNYLKSFNPRPHAGGDAIHIVCPTESIVSIHAPTRGATRDARENNAEQNVSIHAPTRGATSNSSEQMGLMSFQSTPPRGGRRPGSFRLLAQLLFQSTPPRGGRRSIA